MGGGGGESKWGSAVPYFWGGWDDGWGHYSNWLSRSIFQRVMNVIKRTTEPNQPGNLLFIRNKSDA